MSKINRVLITGGTHGNELIGIYLIKKFKRHPKLIERPSFETVLLLANTQAIAAGTRYVDEDLNRCFNVPKNQTAKALSYENWRANEIKAEFSTSEQSSIDVCIDLHGTTANVGRMLILDNSDPAMQTLAAHLCDRYPDVRVYGSTHSGRHQDSLRTIAPHRIGIEVGAVSHGTVHAELFQQTEALIESILDYLEQHNRGTAPPPKNSLTLYQYVGAIDYPRDHQGELLAAVHPQLQFKDYETLRPGDPLFLTFDYRTIAYQGDMPVYPVFINEAAYYEKGIAMCLTQKQSLPIAYQLEGR